jgi:hypothetical protein
VSLGKALAAVLAALALTCFCGSSAAAATGLEPEPTPLLARELIAKLTGEHVQSKGIPTEAHPQFQLEAKGGYTVAVVGLGESVGVVVERGPGLAASAYVVRGTATRGRLQASFGRFGRLSMRFKPAVDPGQADPHRGCHGGHRFLVRRGEYVGQFRFRGEGGYVTVNAHRAKGAVKEVAPRCAEISSPLRLAERAVKITPPAHDSSEHAILAAAWHHGISSAEFLVFESKPGRNDYIVETETSRGRMAIIRAAILFGAGGKFSHDDALTSARVAPPPPFHGAGTYLAAPDGTKTWQGSLSVSLPGVGRLPLTGPPFEVELELFSGDLFF